MANKIEQRIRLAEHRLREGQPAEAERLLKQVLASAPDSAKALELLAYLHGNRGEAVQCEALLDRACALPGASAEALYHLGRVRSQLGRPREALVAYQRCQAKIGPTFEVLHEMAVAHGALAEAGQALALFLAAAELRPGVAEVHFNIGRTLEDLRRFDEALAQYDRALAIQPAQAHVWSNRGVVLSELNRGPEALQSYAKALALAPADAMAWMCQATTLNDLKRHDEALASYDEAMRLSPEADYLLGNWIHTRMLACQWQALPRWFAELSLRIDRGEKACLPFALLATPANAATQLACARRYAGEFGAPAASDRFEARPREGRIRLGYFSSDFHQHATAQLMVRLFECHDRSRFELIAFSFGPNTGDPMRQRIEAAFDRFIDVTARSDTAIAALARELGIDIAVDLKGYTAGARPGIFAQRAAPLQIAYLGYPGTMGCGFIDYLIADETLITVAERPHYTEKIITLPGSYQANDDGKPIAPTTPERSLHGLPEEGFVFACFNNAYKITPDVFDIWMRLLLAVPGSALWLLQGDRAACERLKAEAQSRGVDDGRLVWAPRLELPAHLARHAHADLFLDTFHYNAHTTCSDALWAGLPVLSLRGGSFASRVAASLLNAVGLPELVTHSAEAYEELGLALATDAGRLAGLRRQLIEHRRGSALFDTPRFCRHIEAAFDEAWQRQTAGLTPDHFSIEPSPSP